MSFTELEYLNEDDDDVYYCSHAVSRNGSYIARCSSDYNIVEVYNTQGDCTLVKRLNKPHGVCFVSDVSVLISDSANSRIVEYLMDGKFVRKIHVDYYLPYSIACDGLYIIITLMGWTGVRVYDYLTGEQLRNIDLSDYFEGTGLTLSVRGVYNHVIVHDMISEKVGVVDHTTGEFVKYIPLSGDYADVFDLGNNMYVVGKYNQPVEVRDWETDDVVDTCIFTKEFDSLLAVAPQSKRLLVQLSEETEEVNFATGWHLPWRFTYRSAWIRLLW